MLQVHPVEVLSSLPNTSLTPCSMSDVDDIYALHDDDLSPIENSSDRRMAGQDYQSEYHYEQPLQESSGFISASQTTSTTETSTSTSSDSQKKSGKHA